MSADTLKRIGSDPGRLKKKGMWLNPFGNYHLSNNQTTHLAKREYGNGDAVEIVAHFVIASAMSLWRSSTSEQSSCKEVPRQFQFEVPSADCKIRNRDQLDCCWDMKTAATKTSSITATTFPCFRTKQGYRSKVSNLSMKSRQAFNQQEATNFPDKSNEQRLNGLEISKDFGNQTFLTILQNAITINALASAGQLLQSSSDYTSGYMYRNCETVVTSTTKQEKESKFLSEKPCHKASDKDYNSNFLGIFPILSSAIQLNQFSELWASQAHAIKNLITCAITVRLILLGQILEHLQKEGHSNVNKTDKLYKSSANANGDNVEESESDTEKSVVINKMAMANHENEFFAFGGQGGGDEGEDRMGAGAGEGGDMGLQNVPDYGAMVNRGDIRGHWDEEMEVMDDRVVPNIDAQIQERSNIEDEFANRLICDFDEIPEYLAPLNAALPAEEVDLDFLLNHLDDILEGDDDDPYGGAPHAG